MKNFFSFKKQQKLSYILGLSLSALMIVSCSKEEISNSEETNTLSSTNSSYATPETGKIYTIQNRRSGRTLDIENRSNNNGANLQLWGTNTSNPGTHRQWEVISTEGNYVRLKGVDSGKSLEVSAGNNANRANVQQWAYQGTTHQQWEIISTGSGYFRLKSRDSGKSLWADGTSNGSNVAQYAYSGWLSQQWFFTEVGSSSTPTPPTNSTTPGGILGIDNNDWKLNGFTATPSSSATYYDDVMNQVNGNISTWSNNNYFYANNGWAYFKCYRGLGGSSNSGNPRVELRERINGSLANWNGSSGTHSMEFDVRVDQLPIDADNNGGVLCFAQIHGPDENSSGVEIDDLIRLQFLGSSNQSSGGVRLKISGYITEEVQGSSLIIDNGYQLDTSYTFKIQYSGGTVRVYEGGSQIFSQSVGTSANGNYFKLGNYLQSVQGASFTGSYGLVGIKNLTVSH